jgi:hypothetical protein
VKVHRVVRRQDCYILYTLGSDGGEAVSFTRRPPLTPRKKPGTHFCIYSCLQYLWNGLGANTKSQTHRRELHTRYSLFFCKVRLNMKTELPKSSIFWDVIRCSPSKVNRRFGGTYRLHLQTLLATCFHAGFLLRLFFALKIEIICSSETLVTFKWTTRRDIPEYIFFITTAARTSDPTQHCLFRTFGPKRDQPTG